MRSKTGTLVGLLLTFWNHQGTFQCNIPLFTFSQGSCPYWVTLLTARSSASITAVAIPAEPVLRLETSASGCITGGCGGSKTLSKPSASLVQPTLWGSHQPLSVITSVCSSHCRARPSVCWISIYIYKVFFMSFTSCLSSNEESDISAKMTGLKVDYIERG